MHIIWTTVSAELECNKAELFAKDSFWLHFEIRKCHSHRLIICMTGVTQINPQATVLQCKVVINLRSENMKRRTSS